MYKNSPDRTHTITLHLLALAIGALLMGALMTVPTTARASVSYEPVTSLPEQLGSQSTGSQVELSFDGQTRAYAFRKLGQGGNPNRTRIVYSGDRGGTWQSHYVTEATVPSDGGVLGMSDDGQIMAVSYKRYPGVYAKFTFDGGANWSMEKTLSDGTSGRAWAPKVAVSGNGQTLVHSWFQKVSGKDTAHFTFSSDAGQTWSNPIQPSTPGATEHDVNVATSADGQTIALGWKSDNTTTQGYYTFDGGLNWIAKNISAEGTGTTGSSMPQLAVSGDGDTLAYIWTDAVKAVQAAVTMDAGASWASKVLSSGKSNAGWPQALLSFDGNHQLFGWADYDSSDWTTRLAHTSDSGQNWTNHAVSQGGSNASGPNLAMSRDGAVMTGAWREEDSDGVYNIWAHYSTNSGTDWTAKQLSEGGPENTALYRHAAVSGDGTTKAYAWQAGTWPNPGIQTTHATTGIVDPAPAPADPAPVTAPKPPAQTNPSQPANVAPQRLAKLKAATKKLQRKLRKSSAPKAMKMSFKLEQESASKLTGIQWKIKLQQKNGKSASRSKEWSSWRDGSLNSQATRARINLGDAKRMREAKPGSRVSVQARALNSEGPGSVTRASFRVPRAAPTLSGNG